MAIRERMTVKEEVIYIQKQAEGNQGKKGQSVVECPDKTAEVVSEPLCENSPD